MRDYTRLKVVKFVHLAPVQSLRSIGKKGILMGSGRRGKGVYCVPLVMMNRQIQITESDDKMVSLTSGQVSSVDLWKWLVKPRAHAAIMFELASASYPIDVYIYLRRRLARRVLAEIASEESVSWRWIPEYLNDYRDSAGSHWIDIALSLSNARILGVLLRSLGTCGFRPEQFFSDELEVVIRNPIPRRAVCAIVPMYETNKEFRSRKHLRHVDTEEED